MSSFAASRREDGKRLNCPTTLILCGQPRCVLRSWLAPTVVPMSRLVPAVAFLVAACFAPRYPEVVTPRLEPAVTVVAAGEVTDSTASTNSIRSFAAPESTRTLSAGQSRDGLL